jgi:NTE family protein
LCPVEASPTLTSVTILDLRRRTHGPKTAFVLGGGGNLGAVQVGMLRAVLERGVAPDLLVGCSVGALNAAMIAAEPSPEGGRRLEEVWTTMRGEELLPSGHLSALWLLARKGRAMHENDALRRLVEQWLPFERFEDAAVPLHVVATSLRTCREHWFSTGPVVKAILASAALPAVFPPVDIDGEQFIDGGVVDNVPISRAVALGARRVYVFHVGNFDRARPEAKRPLDVLLQAFSIARSHRFLSEMASPPADVELVTLPAIDPGGLRRNDFARSAQLIERAYATTAAFLDGGARVASGA